VVRGGQLRVSVGWVRRKATNCWILSLVRPSNSAITTQTEVVQPSSTAVTRISFVLVFVVGVSEPVRQKMEAACSKLVSVSVGSQITVSATKLVSRRKLHVFVRDVPIWRHPEKKIRHHLDSTVTWDSVPNLGAADRRRAVHLVVQNAQWKWADKVFELVLVVKRSL
jgi:hypothetical protein